MKKKNPGTEDQEKHERSALLYSNWGFKIHPICHPQETVFPFKSASMPLSCHNKSTNKSKIARDR